MPQLIVGPAILALVAGYAASQAFNTGSKIPITQSDTGNYGFQLNAQSSKYNIPVVYGQIRIGINRAFMASSGADNQYLHIIGIIGEGEIEGFSDQVGGVDPLYLDNKLYTEFGSGNVYYELFTGTSTQTVCSTLQTAVSDWTDPLRYTAYVYVRLKFDKDKFQGIPEISLGIKGLKVLNPNTSVTEYSNNPALCTYNMMTRSPVRGGFGISGSRITTATVESARAYCAAMGWTCNMPIVDNNPIVDNLQLILNNFRGDIVKSGSSFAIKFRDLNYESVVMALDEDDILDGSFSAGQPDIFSSPNVIKVEYLDETGASDGSSSYKTKTYTHTDPDASADETYVESQIKCWGLSDLDLVQQMAYYLAERNKLNKTCTIQARQRTSQLEPMDLITITHTVPGWSAKYFRVLDVMINPDDTVQLLCLEEHLDFYDTVYDSTLASFYDTTLPNIQDEPAAVINAALSEEVYDYRGRSFTRLKCDFDPPAAATDPFFDGAQVFVKIGSGDYHYMTKSEGDYLLDPVEEGEIYYIKLVSVNIYGVSQADTNAVILSKTIAGLTAVPTSLSSMTAAANGDSVSIFSDPVTDSDIEGYEVRLGDAWDGAIFISFNKNCSLRLNGVRPGTHAFWMSPKDNDGNYSSTPVSAEVKVFIPPGYTQLATYGSWSWDFTTGSHSNTEHDTYDSGDAMKCSHTSNVLSGTWTSPTMDLNAVEDVRIWGDFLTAFESSDTTWAGVAPSGVTWSDLGAGSWSEIFEPSIAGKIQATLFHSTDNSNWDEVDFFEVLCAEVTARYIKVEVTIVDPALDSNLYLKELNMVAYEGPQ